jgi:hypothetical protein
MNKHVDVASDSGEWASVGVGIGFWCWGAYSCWTRLRACVCASGCGDTMGLEEVGVRWRWRWHWLLISGAEAVGRRILEHPGSLVHVRVEHQIRCMKRRSSWE